MQPKNEVEAHGQDPNPIDVLDLLTKHAYTARELAEVIGLSIPATSLKLNKLWKKGVIEKRKYRGTFHFYKM